MANKVDNWYLEAKNDTEILNNKYTNKHVQIVNKNKKILDEAVDITNKMKIQFQLQLSVLPSHIASDVISFHYVSLTETRLLYLVLSKNITMDVYKLYKIWPGLNGDIGPYSIPLHNITHAEQLYEFLFNRVTILNCKICLY